MEVSLWNDAMGAMESDLRENVQRICRPGEKFVLIHAEN
jgi:hypothetical protein